MKKLFFACVLALVIILGINVTAFANTNDYSIVIGENTITVYFSNTGNPRILSISVDGVQYSPEERVNAAGGTTFTRTVMGTSIDIHASNGNGIEWVRLTSPTTQPGPQPQFPYVPYEPVEISRVYVLNEKITRVLTDARIGMHIHQLTGNQNEVTFTVDGNILVTTVTTAQRTVTVQGRERQFNPDTREFVGEPRNLGQPYNIGPDLVTEGTVIVKGETHVLGTRIGNVPYKVDELVHTRNNSAGSTVVGPFRINFETIGNTNVRALSAFVVQGSVPVVGGIAEVAANVPITFSQPTWSMHNGRSGVSSWNPQGNVRNNPQPW